MLARLNPGMVNQLNPQDNFGGTVYTFNGGITTEAVAGNWSASWGTLVSSLSQDIAGFEISSSTAGTGGVNNAALIEIRYTLGGTSTTVVETMPMGGATAQRSMFFPIFLPGGASVEWRVKSLQTSFAYSLSAQFFPMCDPAFGTWVRPFTGCFCTGIDAVTTLAGPTVTGGNSAWGSPTSLGTTADDAYAVRCIPHISQSSIGTASGSWARLSVGGVIQTITRFSTSNGPAVNNNVGIMPVPTYIPKSSTVNCEVFNGTASATPIFYTAQCFYGPK